MDIGFVNVYFEKVRRGYWRVWNRNPKFHSDCKQLGVVLKMRKPECQSMTWCFLPTTALAAGKSYGGVAYGHSRKFAVGVYMKGIRQDLRICAMHPERNYSRV